MERTIYSELISWKNSANRKPLVLEGARQTGKTWLLKEFGRREFPQCIYVNCDNNPLLDGLFSDYDISRIIRFLSALYNTEIRADDTLIIFDEIQEIPSAIAALKYFNENSKYFVAAAGSLLGLSIHGGSGFPVGNVEILKLYPMSFEEFLLADGKEQLVKWMRSGNFSEICALAPQMIELLRQYYYVGGMPEAVLSFVSTGNLQNVRKIQKSILDSYRLDISKHAPKTDIPKIHMVWDSLPSQLAKENKKFIFGVLKKGARAKEFENALDWLQNAGLIYKIPRVNKLCKPLKFYEDLSAFKIFVCDLGLLGAMSDVSAADILAGNKGFVEYKGALTEQYFAQEYVAKVGECPCYYTNEKSTLELDFVFERGSVCIAEVKAEENLRSKSLQTSLAENPDLLGCRFSMKNYLENGRITNIPLYLVSQWLESCRKN